MTATASPLFTTLIDCQDVLTHLDDPDWCVIDVRHDLGNVQAGRIAYAEGHVPGAFFLHLDEDLSGPKNGRNGRHPLPEPAVFAARLRSLGVSAETQVVVYDAAGGMMAARVWWMLRWLGHAAVAVLDGGWPAWLAAGGAQTQTMPAPRATGRFVPGTPLVSTVDADGVLANIASAQRLVVDARAPDRFRGENETLDPVGGHIPGACNRFFRDNLMADGRFKSPAQLRQEWSAVLGERGAGQAIMQCGSGVTACHNLLALEYAGLPGAALYPGSWSEWCSDPVRPVARGS